MVNPGYRYGPEVNVYRYGTLATTLVGVIRLSTIIVFVFGALIYFPAYTYSYFRPAAKTSEKEEEVKWYIPPLFLIGSTVPMLAAFFVFAPWVHQIHISIPARARKSREDLLRWARNVPLDTRVSISVIRASFSPTVQRAAFGELARLPPSFTRLTNLEIRRNDNYIHDLENHKTTQRSPIMEELAHRVYGRLFVNRDQKQDKSAAPGVWDIMWEQIPSAAEREMEMRMQEQRKIEAKPPGPKIKPSRPKY